MVIIVNPVNAVSASGFDQCSQCGIFFGASPIKAI
jgi:hypothetical protein